jgi:hypothetical protein
MKKERKEIENYNSLINETNAFVNSLPKDYKLFVCGGHFPLYFSPIEKKVLPGIYQEIADEKSREDVLANFGGFPLFTWEIACNIVNKGVDLGIDSQLLLLINDWQEVPAFMTQDLSLPNPYRETFFNNFNHLPSTYNKVFSTHKLDFDNNIFKLDESKFYLKELNLRDRFKRYIKKNYKIELDLNECHYSDGNFEYDSNLLIEKGNAGCAGEISQMIYETIKVDEKVAIINFLPLCCKNAVNIGTELIYNLFNKNPKVLNVFLCTQNTIHKNDFFDKESENKNPRIYSYE